MAVARRMDEADLLERERELERLADLLDAAGRGHGRMVIIEGPPGIGKTRLLAALTTEARTRGIDVLTARAGRLERGLGFGVVRQLFEPALSTLPIRDRKRLLSDAASFAAPHVTPENPPAMETQEAFDVYHGLYWLCSNMIERRPLTLAIDDAQWSDLPTLRFLAYLLRRLNDLSILVALTRRSGPADEVLDQIAVDSAVEVMRLSPLSEVAVALRTAGELGAAPPVDFSVACHRATGGNPFLVSQVLTELRLRRAQPSAAAAVEILDLHPAAVARAVVDRLDDLSPAAAHLARAVAVLGGEAELAVAAEVAGLSVGEALEGAGALEQADILSTSQPAVLRHAIIAAAIYSALAPVQRDEGHLRAAQALARRGAEPESVGTHLLGVAPRAEVWIVEELIRAGDAAVLRGAPGSGVDFLKRALAEPAPARLRPKLLAALGSAELSGGADGAVAHLTEALALASPPDRPSVARALAVALASAGDAAGAVGVLEEAISAVAAHDDELALELEAELVAYAKFDIGLAAFARPHLESLRERANAGTRGGRMALAEVAFHQLCEGTRADDSASLAERSLEGMSGLFAPGRAGAHFYQAVYVLIACDRFQSASRLLGEAMSAGRRAGSVFTVVLASDWHAHLAWRVGSLRDSEAGHLAALELVRLHGFATLEPGMTGHLVETLVDRGDLAGAQRLLAESSADFAIADGLATNVLLESRAALRLAQGRYREALTDLEEFGRREHGRTAGNPATSAWRSRAALALHALGRTGEARVRAREEVARARRFGTPRSLGISLHAAGLVAGPQGPTTQLEEAVRVLRNSEARLAYAAALGSLAAATRRLGRPAESRALFREALAIADHCGAVRLRRRLRDELLAAGGRPRVDRESGGDVLTPSERRIAVMAEEGLGNRQIAQALFLSLKTVEMHLSHTYRKLGIGSRRELTDALRDVS